MGSDECGQLSVLCFGRRATKDDGGHGGAAEQARDLDALLAEVWAATARLRREGAPGRWEGQAEDIANHGGASASHELAGMRSRGLWAML